MYVLNKNLYPPLQRLSFIGDFLIDDSSLREFFGAFHGTIKDSEWFLLTIDI